MRFVLTFVVWISFFISKAQNETAAWEEINLEPTLLIAFDHNCYLIPDSIHLPIASFLQERVEVYNEMIITEISVANGGEIYCYTLLHQSTVKAKEEIEEIEERYLFKTGNYSGYDRGICITSQTKKIDDLKYQ